MYLEQVVAILLTNALKYGAGKPVVVSVGESEGRAHLTVRDAGVGIATERLPRIFDRYDRGDASLDHGGLGLGLWIALQIVRSMNGTITAESAVGMGSFFMVELPPISTGEKNPSGPSGSAARCVDGCGCGSGKTLCGF